MLRITIELLPKGRLDKARHLGTGYISNDGTGAGGIGNYDVTLSQRGRPGCVWKRGRVIGFPRKRLGAWDLLFRVLQVTVGNRNG